MTTATQVVDAARSEVGYTECPQTNGRCAFTGHKGGGQNHNKFAVEAGLTNGTYWCAAFTSAILKRTGAPVPPGVLTLSTRLNMAAWKKAGQWVAPADIHPGDVVFYHLTGRNGTDHNTPDHTGIATGPPIDGRQPAVEGNTSSDYHGSQDNGGCVATKHRAVTVVIGAGRPNYDNDTPQPPAPPTEDEDMPVIYHCVSNTNPPVKNPDEGANFLLVGNELRPLTADENAEWHNSGAVERDIQPHAWKRLQDMVKRVG